MFSVPSKWHPTKKACSGIDTTVKKNIEEEEGKGIRGQCTVECVCRGRPYVEKNAKRQGDEKLCLGKMKSGGRMDVRAPAHVE